MKDSGIQLIVVPGPTASGKSALGIALAQRFHGEIVSADSRQVYRGLDIGTAKVTAEERALVPHHLLDIADVQEIYTVSQFQQQAIAAINDIAARGLQPFLVGGSPHYIQAVVDNLDIPAVPPQPALRAELEARPLAELLAQQLNRPSEMAAHEQLSEREFQVFLKLAKGETAGDIAKALSLSVKTVSTYRTRVMEKMSLASNSDLTYYALKNKLID